MYIWLTARTFASDDWRLEVPWSFIDALALMVGYWSSLSYFNIMIYLVVEFLAIWFLLMVCSWLISFDFLPILKKLSNWFPTTYVGFRHVYMTTCSYFPYIRCSILMLESSRWYYFHNFSVLICLWGKEPHSLVFSSHYLSVWLGFGSCDFSATLWLSPYL